MGMWDYEPWANDSAADWFAEFMDVTSLRDRWAVGITADPEEEFEVVRAAAWVFLQLGRPYVWTDTLDDDGDRTIAALKTISVAERVVEDEALVSEITQEIAELESRRSA